MTTLILIRHGESEANRNSVFAGHIDPDLQNRGMLQAMVTAEYITENYKVDKIYSSDLKRAYRTALCLAEKIGAEVATDENLREIYAGQWEGKKFSDIETLYPKEYDVWKKHIGRCVCTGGESVEHLGKRVMSALTSIAKENEGKTVAIATHATPIRAAQSIIQCGSVDEMENILWVPNASVTVLEYNNNEWRVVSVSIDKHLEKIKTILPSNV